MGNENRLRHSARVKEAAGIPAGEADLAEVFCHVDAPCPGKVISRVKGVTVAECRRGAGVRNASACRLLEGYHGNRHSMGGDTV